jgi:hypothetical protein
MSNSNGNGSTPTKRPVGRPPLEYDPEIGSLICYELIKGKSLRKICKDNPTVPSIHSIYKWLQEVPEFAEQYQKARLYQADTFLEEILDTARDTSDDITFSKDGTPITNNKAINRARLICDNLKWVMGRLNARKYGDIQRVEHSGMDSSINVHVNSPGSQSREQWLATQQQMLDQSSHRDENQNSNPNKDEQDQGVIEVEASTPDNIFSNNSEE